MMRPIFELRNVSRFYSTRGSLVRARQGGRNAIRAVDDVSLEVQKEEVLGIIGESGSGKTTLGFLIAGIETLSQGDIHFDGQPTRSMSWLDRRLFRQRVQVVFQDSGSALNPRRRVLSTLQDSLRLRGVPRHERVEKALALLGKVGLSGEFGARYPHEMSGGQRQRVGIARALAMQPDVLIADEPVSALDVSLQGQIINLLLELRRELRLTIILISHDIAVISQTCDRVAVMYRGVLRELGPTSDIIQNPADAYTKQLIGAVPKGLAGRHPARHAPLREISIYD